MGFTRKLAEKEFSDTWGFITDHAVLRSGRTSTTVRIVWTESRHQDTCHYLTCTKFIRLWYRAAADVGGGGSVAVSVDLWLPSVLLSIHQWKMAANRTWHHLPHSACAQQQLRSKWAPAVASSPIPPLAGQYILESLWDCESDPDAQSSYVMSYR